MEIVTIKESSGSVYVKELRIILEAEWGVFTSFEEKRDGLIPPPPIVAIDQGILLGGLLYRKMKLDL